MVYGDGTKRYFDLLAQEGLSDLSQDKELLVVRQEIAELSAAHPTDQERAQRVLLHPLGRIPARRGLAIQYGIHATEIPMFLSLSRRIRTEVVLASVLMQETPPTVYEVNHLLMEVGSPCLFYATAYPDVNRRNYLLCKIIEYAHSKGPYAAEGSWLDFAEAVLDKFRDIYQSAVEPGRWGEDEKEMERLRRLVPKEVPVVTFTQEETEMMDLWRWEIDRTIGYCDYSQTRAEYLNSFMQQTGLTRGQAITRLADEIFVTRETCSALFARMTAANSKGSRETLLSLAAAMGCSIDQANVMLLQVNEPLLYPFQKLTDDTYWLRKLSPNTP